MTSSSIDPHVRLLEDVYVGIFQRDLDDSGRIAFGDEFASGNTTLASVLRTLRTSEEFANRVTELTAIGQWKKIVVDVPDLVKSSYEAILSRPCDPDGLHYYTARLLEQGLAADDFLRCLASSPEARARPNRVAVQADEGASSAAADDDSELEYRFRAELLSAGFRLQLA